MRLTNAIREEILRKLNEHISAELEEIGEMDPDHKLALKARDIALGKHKEAYDSLPDGWKFTDSSIHIELVKREPKHERSITLDLPHGVVCRRTWGYGWGNDANRLQIAKEDHPEIYEPLDKWLTRKAEITERHTKVLADAREVLHSVTTVKRLQELWPKVNDFYSFPVVPMTKALAVHIPDLDTRIDELAAKKAAA